jgi:hypothetical protein
LLILMEQVQGLGNPGGPQNPIWSLVFEHCPSSSTLPDQYSNERHRPKNIS